MAPEVVSGQIGGRPEATVTQVSGSAAAAGDPLVGPDLVGAGEVAAHTNGTRNWGLFQISDARLRERGGTPRQALDPEWNIRAAHRLWSSGHDFHDWPHCERAVKHAPTATPR
ncbi:hypothetical protein ABZ027_15365 [Streptomyces sp. NPDC006332]|uniref:hypothetical protein n=1 Tax=Streptomyces sp. NPDC006332 TaxID=3155456 RepID=UPI0033B1DCCB